MIPSVDSEMELAIPGKDKRVWFILSTTKKLSPLGSLKIRDAFFFLFFFFLVCMRYYPGGQGEKRCVHMNTRGGNGRKTFY